MTPDRSHVHHKLIDMGMSQKQAVGTLYVITAILGLSAVVLTASNALKAIVVLVALALVALIGWKIYSSTHFVETKAEEKEDEEQ